MQVPPNLGKERSGCDVDIIKSLPDPLSSRAEPLEETQEKRQPALPHLAQLLMEAAPGEGD